MIPRIATLHSKIVQTTNIPTCISLRFFTFLTQSPSCLVPFCSEKCVLIDDAIDAIQI